MSNLPDVLCAGIIVADHVCTPISHVPAAGELVTSDNMLLTIGGCAANTAVDLRKMGVSAAVAGRVGDDIFGRVVIDMLEHTGVDVSPIRVTAGHSTSQTMIVNVAGDDRRFIHTFGANAVFSSADIPAEIWRKVKVLYLGGYLVMPEVRPADIAKMFEEVRRIGVRTVLDVVTPGPGDYLKQFEPLLPHVDVFLPNQHEAELILGVSDPLGQAVAFHRMGAGTVVITMGGNGAFLVDARQRLRAGVYPVDYVDGSGGGDAFDAGFIYGLLNGKSATDCLRVASALGASCVRAIGTTPGVFTREECESFLANHELIVEAM
jgi:sugar/nucleoside kinase (ribokinase family)